MLFDQSPAVRGIISAYDVSDVGPCPLRFSKPNQIQYPWGFAAAQCLGFGQRGYVINALYMEYENVGAPDDVVTVPVFDRHEGLEYYASLQSSGSQDFLRLPLPYQPSLGIAPGYEDFFIPGVNGNMLTYNVQSSGVVGVGGKTFSDSVNSKVYGVALVATPVLADWTQDVIVARAYFETADQVVKEPSKQLGVTWGIIFG